MPAMDMSCSGVKALIDGLDSSKAPGPDHIRPKLLKLIPEDTSQCLKLIFESSLRKSEVPKDWKIATITPLFKKGAKSDPKNYRPVSLTSITLQALRAYNQNGLVFQFGKSSNHCRRATWFSL